MNCSEGAVNDNKQVLHGDLGWLKVTSREQNLSKLLSTCSLKDNKALVSTAFTATNSIIFTAIQEKNKVKKQHFQA